MKSVDLNTDKYISNVMDDWRVRVIGRPVDIDLYTTADKIEDLILYSIITPVNNLLNHYNRY